MAQYKGYKRSQNIVYQNIQNDEQSLDRFNKKSVKSELLLPETVSLANEDYIAANAQILILETSNSHFDIYDNWLDIVQINFYSEDDLSCPICMEPPVIPRTDICGHVYCLPCLNKFLSFKSEFGNNCAICHQNIDITRVKRAGVIHRFSPRVGDTLSMLLMKRSKRGSIATPIDILQSGIPLADSSVSRFSNVARCSNDYLLSVIQMEIMALEDEFKAAMQEGNDRVQSISDALDSARTEFEVASLTSSVESKKERSRREVTVESVKETMVHENVYYQSEEGGNVFTCNVNWRCIAHQFLDHGLCLPLRLSAPIIDIERFIVTSEFHNRYRYLRHLPLGSSASFVELDLAEVVSPATLGRYEAAIRLKSDARLQREQTDARDTRNKIRHENSFHDGARFVHIPSLMASTSSPGSDQNVDVGDSANKTFSQTVRAAGPSLCSQMVSLSVDERDGDPPASRGISISDCLVVTKSKRRNRRR